MNEEITVAERVRLAAEACQKAKDEGQRTLWLGTWWDEEARKMRAGLSVLFGYARRDLAQQGFYAEPNAAGEVIAELGQ